MSDVVAVTGATGRIGRHLVDALLHAGLAVRALSRLPRRARDGVEWITGDLLDRAAVASLVRGSRVVLHAGGQIAGSAEAIHRSLVGGTANVLQSAGESTRVVHLSSLVVLDTASRAGSALIDESSRLEPDPGRRGHYTQAKCDAEAMVREAAARQDVVIVRPGLVVGGDGDSTVVPLGVGVVSGRWVIFAGAGSAELPVVHVNDVASGVLCAADVLQRGDVIHLIDPMPVTRQRLFRRLAGDSAGKSAIDVNWLMLPTARILARISGNRVGNTGYRLLAAGTSHRWSAARAVAMGWHPTHLAGWLATADPRRYP